MRHPISYSFPDELWVDSIPTKKFIFSSHLPNSQSNTGYTWTNSHEYLQVYRDSVFGLTHKKCGWDAYRHLEILSQGACMYMLDIDHIPKKTMTRYPLEHIKGFMDKYGRYSLEFILKHGSSILYQDLNCLLEESKKTLTSSAMLNYILETTSHNTSKNILASFDRGDYILHSLHYAGKRAFGSKFCIYSDGPVSNTDYLYTDYSVEDSLKLYGRGFNYSRLLDPKLKSTETNDEILQNIKERHYDCIILSKQNSLLIPALTYYEPSEIIVICGNDCNPLFDKNAGWVTIDQHFCEFQSQSDIHIFQRELGM